MKVFFFQWKLYIDQLLVPHFNVCNMRIIPAGIKYMQSGDIAFGLKYLPDEPASTDAVSLSLLVFQIILKQQCCDSENDYVIFACPDRVYTNHAAPCK
jgi:hypothetical protein